MLITIIILVLSAVFFVNGKIRSDLVALCALVALLIFQILTPGGAVCGWRSDFSDGTCQNDQFTHSEISG